MTTHTTLGRLKRHVLNQVQLPHGKYKPEFAPVSHDIKKRLLYDGLIETLGELDIVHVDGTKTILLHRDTCEQVVHNINETVLSPNGLTIHNLPVSVYQKSPKDVSRPITLKSQDELKELMRHVHQNFHRKHALKKTDKLKNTHSKKLAQYRSAVQHMKTVNDCIENGDRLVCIDVEAFEFNQNIILEIGITTFQSGTINTRHLIIEERIKTVNKRHVPNHKHHFLFGESEILPLRDAIAIVKQEMKGCDRLVGHSVSGDIDWLSKHGVKFNTNIVYFDTSFLCKAYFDSNKTRMSLKDVCEKCGIDMEYAHNGGNDSRYNMQALLALTKMTPYKQST